MGKEGWRMRGPVDKEEEKVIGNVDKELAEKAKLAGEYHEPEVPEEKQTKSKLTKLSSGAYRREKAE